MIRSIYVALDGILFPRLSRTLWVSLKTLDAASANKAMERVFPLIPRWKSGTLGEEEFWAAAAPIAGYDPKSLKEVFLGRFAIDPEVCGLLNSLAPRYSVVINMDLPPSLRESIAPGLIASCPSPVVVKAAEEGFSRENAEDDTLYLIADSALSYDLAAVHAHVVLFTNLFRLKRELKLQRLL